MVVNSACHWAIVKFLTESIAYSFLAMQFDEIFFLLADVGRDLWLLFGLQDREGEIWEGLGSLEEREREYSYETNLEWACLQWVVADWMDRCCCSVNVWWLSNGPLFSRMARGLDQPLVCPSMDPWIRLVHRHNRLRFVDWQLSKRCDNFRLKPNLVANHFAKLVSLPYISLACANNERNWSTWSNVRMFKLIILSAAFSKNCFPNERSSAARAAANWSQFKCK